MSTTASLSSASAGSESQEAPSMGEHHLSNASDGIAIDESKSKNVDAAGAGAKVKKKKKKIRPRLKPISSHEDVSEDEETSPFGNYLPATRDNVGNAAPAAADEPTTDAVNVAKKSVIATPLPPPKAARVKLRPSVKIQPRSSPFTPGDIPQTPDDDDYDAFGFGLVKSGMSPKPKSPKESLEAALRNNSNSNLIGGTTQEPTTKESSPVALRRCLSSESYISDDSSSSEEIAFLKRDLMKDDDELEHVFVNERKRENQEIGGSGNNNNNNNNDTTTTTYAPKRIHSRASSQATEERSQMSSVSFAPSAFETGTYATTDNADSSRVHLLGSFNDDNSGGINNSHSFSSDSSDGESSYFSAHRAQTQSSSMSSYPNNSRQNSPAVPLTSPPKQLSNTPPLLMRSNSLPHNPPPAAESAARNVIELKLSLSEDENASSGRRSTDSEGMGMGDGERATRRHSSNSNFSSRESPPTRQQSTTPFSQESVDDQGIANELRVYSLSDRLSQGSLASLPPTGRDAPVDGHHVGSVLQHPISSHNETPSPVRSFYATPPRSTAKPRAHHDSSFLTNLRGGWAGSSATSVSEGSFISSPRGAFGEPEAEERSTKSSGNQTPQSNLLAYSDEEDHERRIRRDHLLKSSGFSDRNGDEEEAMAVKNLPHDGTNFEVYPTRWLVLLYISLLILLSDWTCYSIAPISILTAKALNVDSEILVTVFLASNIIGTFFEPIILGWLGLRRTVLLGALLLLTSNVVKSSSASWTNQFDEQTILYIGFFIAGWSQPLYQCTSAILVNGWFPEQERAFAMGVALNCKQLGIGCSFIFGTLLVKTGDDVLPYFHLLSVMSVALFVGMAMQFEDAPPTPPLETARVIRGTVERPLVARDTHSDATRGRSKIGIPSLMNRRVRSSNSQQSHGQGGANNGSSKTPVHPSRASFGSTSSIAQASTTELAMEKIDTDGSMSEFESLVHPPAPLMPGPVTGGPIESTPNTYQSYGSTDTTSLAGQQFANAPKIPGEQSDDMPSPFPSLRIDHPHHGTMPFRAGLEYYNFGPQFQPKDHLPAAEDDGAEPILIQTPRHIDIYIRGDQIWQSLRACFARKGFSHCVFAFAASGIMMNTLSTFMGYLVKREEYVGMVGGSFQLLIMLSSMMSGRWTDETRKSYFIIIALLALGALALALCDANLDLEENLWLYILMVAVFLGPLQRCSLSLGVEVSYPLSENTVLVILQMFSNLLSSACIPAFKMLRDISAIEVLRNISSSVPDFTYSFYLLVLIHALATLYFASFDIQHLRDEENERKKKRTEQIQSSGQDLTKISYLKPKPPLGRDQPWGKKYPFLVPSS